MRNANEERERRVEARTAELVQQAAELTKAKEALQQSNLDLQKFAYIASRDLQAPLRTISGFVQLLQGTYRDKLDATAMDWIQRTAKGTQRMHALIGELLAYAQVDTSARPLLPTDLNEVFDETLQWLAAAVLDVNATVMRSRLPVVAGGCRGPGAAGPAAPAPDR